MNHLSKITPTYDFVINQGSTFKVIINLKTSDGETPYDLTDATIKGQMRKNYNSTTADATFTVTILDAGGGQFKFVLTDTQTANLAAREYVYDIEMSDGGEVTRIIQGIIQVSPEVTKI